MLHGVNNLDSQRQDRSDHKNKILDIQKSFRQLPSWPIWIWTILRIRPHLRRWPFRSWGWEPCTSRTTRSTLGSLQSRRRRTPQWWSRMPQSRCRQGWGGLRNKKVKNYRILFKFKRPGLMVSTSQDLVKQICCLSKCAC